MPSTLNTKLAKVSYSTFYSSQIYMCPDSQYRVDAYRLQYSSESRTSTEYQEPAEFGQPVWVTKQHIDTHGGNYCTSPPAYYIWG